jgi:hypothetical protein
MQPIETERGEVAVWETDSGHACAGEGLFIAAGKTATLRAANERPSTLLHFFLVPAADLDRPAATAPAAVKELYRTLPPIPDLKPGGYDLRVKEPCLKQRTASSMKEA